MNWLLTAILIIVFLVNFPPIWAAVLTVLLFLLRSAAKNAASSGPDKELADLALLHLELTRLQQTGQMEAARFDRLSREVSSRYALFRDQLRTGEAARREQLEAAWSQLEKSLGQTLGPPPWQQQPEKTLPVRQAAAQTAPPGAKPAVPEPAPRTAIPAKPSPLQPAATPRATPTVPPSEKNHPAEHAVPPKPAPQPVAAITASPPVVAKSAAPEPTPKAAPSSAPTTTPPPKLPDVQPAVLREASPPVPPKKPPQPVQPEEAAKPAKPSALEQFMSHWVKRMYSHRPRRAFLYQVMVPFLLQNIGWFIAGICGVSGSIYLVAATTGYWKALAVLVSLIGYTSLLLGGGCLLRRKRPELFLSSSVLLALGVLLVPLNLTACVRLLAAAGANVLFLGLAAVIALAVFGSFFFAVRAASGMIDRSLTDEHPRLFMALAGLQFAAPFLGSSTHWLWAAGLHLSLLAILGHALQRFTGRWLHSIFIDRRKIAYYAAGTLVYAALVSFVHLTRSTSVELPAGYAGPFLMALSGLLLYVDIQFKQWVKQYAPLSRFTFAVYALSVLAVLLAADVSALLRGQLVPSFCLSLTLGTLLYGGMVWNYLTLPPLYLLIACFGMLYAQLILRPFPGHWHFLLAVPGLYAVMALHRLARRRESAALALVTYRTLLALILILVGWSLLNSPFPPQGIIPMLTPLAAAALVLQVMESTPLRVLQGTSVRRGYLLTGLAVLTLGYAPLLAGSWPEQFSGGLIALALLWTGWGLRRPTLCSSETLFNSALGNLAASLLLAVVPQILQQDLAALSAQPATAFLMTAAAGALLWLSLSLCLQPLFYAALLAGGAGLALLKLHYFPESSGTGILLAALLLWALLWHLQRQAALRTALAEALAENAAAAKEEEKAPLVLLGYFPVSQPHGQSRGRMAIPPLRHAYYALWLAGLGKAAQGILQPQPDPAWAGIALLGALTTLLTAGLVRQQAAAALCCLLPLAAALLLKALAALAPVAAVWQPCLGAGCALLFWLFSCRLAAAPWSRLVSILGWRGGYGSLGGSKLSEHILHWTALAFAVLCTGAAWPNAPAFGVMGQPFAAFLAILALDLLLLWLGDRKYALRLHSYLFIGCAILAGFSLCSWLTDLPPLTLLLHVQYGAPMFSWAAAALALTAWLVGKSADNLWRQPSQRSAVLAYLAALAYSGALFAVSWEQAEMLTKWLPWVFVLLALSLLLLLHPAAAPRQAEAMLAAGRGIGLPVLLSLAFAGFFPEQGLDPYLIIAWGLALWAAGHFLLPPFNARWPQWTVQPWFCLVLGVLSYGWALTDSLRLFWQSMAQGSGPAWLPWLFLALALSYSIILRSLLDAPRLRSIGAVLLLSIAVASCFAGSLPLLPYGLIAWSFVLWAAGTHLLPRLNERLPWWSFDPSVWLAAGLLLVAGAVMAAPFLPISLWPILIGATVYLLLLSRVEAWAWLVWPAGLGVAASGLNLLAALFPPAAQDSISLPFLLGAAAWLNLMLRIRPSLPPAATAELPPPGRLDKAFLFWPSLILGSTLFLLTVAVLVMLAATDSGTWLHALRERPAPLILLSVLLSASFLHLAAAGARFSAEWRRVCAHLLLLSLTNTVLLLWLTSAASGLPLLLEFWAGLLQAGIVFSPSVAKAEPETPSAAELLKDAGWMWLPWLYGAALLTLVFARVSSGERVLALVLLNGLSFGMLDRRGKELTAFRQTLRRVVPFFSYLWVLAEILRLQAAGSIPLWLPPTFVLLAIVQVPLLPKGATASRLLRGIAMPLLLTLAVVSTVLLLPPAAGNRAEILVFALAGWGFGLWAAGSLIFPRFNMRWPQWAVFPDFSMLFGLVLSLGSLGAHVWLKQQVFWPLPAAATLHLLLLQRNARWQWTIWPASFGLTWTGALLLLQLFPLLPFRAAADGSLAGSMLHLLPGCPSVPYAFGLLLWLNLLLHVPRFFREDKGSPFIVWPFLLFCAGLLGIVLLIAGALLHDAGLVSAPAGADGRVITLTVALSLSFLHVFVLRPRRLTAHCLLLSAQAALILLFISSLSLPLLFSLNMVGLLLALSAPHPQAARLARLAEAAQPWLPLNFNAALLCLAIMPNFASGEQQLALLLLGGAGIALGLQREKRLWQTSGAVLLLIALHTHWLLWLPQARWTSLLPWNALQVVLLGRLALWLQQRGRLSAFAATNWPLLSLLAALEWLGHGVLELRAAIVQTDTISAFGLWDHAAAIAAGLLLAGLWLRKIENHALLVYSLSAAILLLSGYVRLVWAGLMPCTVWDTAALLSAGFILLSLQRVAPASLPLYRLTLLLPILALLTVPWQAGSVHAGSTLAAATAIFLLMQRSGGQSMPVYLAFLAMNTCCYLWVPGLYQEYRLVQIYTVPMALTVLIMLQLHFVELRPSVLNAVRLAALSALYASAVLDVFLRPELYVFALALGLSLLGIGIGIALRVRAFLFAGVIFFVLNIVGQLVNFYPQDRLGKAILLMLAGGAIAGGMIWFSIQREAIMRQIRIMRADLADWE